MFNVLVSGDGKSWETDQLMKMMVSRFKEYSGVEAATVSLERPDTLRALETIQSLLMYESGLPTSDIVRCGHLREIRVSGSDLVFRFVERGRLPRALILEFADRLDMKQWEFGRTHWAVKDGGIPSDLIGRLESRFNVFLSHNSHDKPIVRELKERLAGCGLSAWFDEDELRPGIPWQALLEEGIEKSATVAVLIGSDGLGPWENEEMQAALGLAVADKRPVIPVLLPGAPHRPKLPLFLGNRTWVDLRNGLHDPAFQKLVWGITGVQRSIAAPAPVPSLAQHRLKPLAVEFLLAAESADGMIRETSTDQGGYLVRCGPKAFHNGDATTSPHRRRAELHEALRQLVVEQYLEPIGAGGSGITYQLTTRAYALCDQLKGARAHHDS